MTVKGIPAGWSVSDFLGKMHKVDKPNEVNKADKTQRNMHEYQTDNADKAYEAGKANESYETKRAEDPHNDGEKKSKYATINFIDSSLPDLFSENRIKRFSIEDFITGASATSRTSERIAQDDAGFKQTPAQQRGADAYAKSQSYTNHVSVSNAQYVA